MRKYLIILIILFGNLALCKAQLSENNDTLFSKRFYKNFRFNCEIADSDKNSSLLIFEISINEDGKIKKIVSWNENKWCNYSSFYEAFYKTDTGWLKKNSNTAVLVPVLIMLYDPNSYPDYNIMNKIAYHDILKFEALGKTKFLRPLMVVMPKKDIVIY